MINTAEIKVEVMAATGMAASSKLVLIMMADRLDWKRAERGCWPGIGNLAAATLLSRSTVLRAIAELEGLGWVQRSRRHWGNGSQRNNLYMITPPGSTMTPPQCHHDTPPSVTMTPHRTLSVRTLSEEPHAVPSICIDDTKPEQPELIDHQPELMQSAKQIEERETKIRLVEEIYAAYPRKVDRPKSMKAIQKASNDSGTPLAEILQLTIQYAKIRQHRKPKQSEAPTPHSATWFNGHRFNDDPETWGPEDCVKAVIKTEQNTEQKEQPKWMNPENLKKQKAAIMAAREREECGSVQARDA